jgi:nitrite reductase/ring-hydroxylating ferredoxin subunit
MRGPSKGTGDLGGERWHVLGCAADFPEGSHCVVDIEGRSVGVFNISGELFALRNVCPHQAGPVCESMRATGTMVAEAEHDWRLEWAHDGEIIACPWHGLEFHVPTGRCLGHTGYRLRRYRVRLVEDQVLLSLAGQPDAVPAR